MTSPLTPKRSVWRILTEKMGARFVGEFKGNAGEIFYDPAVPELYISNGPNEDPVPLFSGTSDAILENNDHLIPRNISTLQNLPDTTDN